MYSATYAPLFSLEIELENSSALPEPIRDWWTDPSPRLPPYRLNLFEPVKEVDEDGLPLIPGCPRMTQAEKLEMGEKAFRKMAAYVERLSRGELRL